MTDSNIPSAQPGWVSVPIEPTREMLDASIGLATNLSDWRNSLAVYRAMLNAAPKAAENPLYATPVADVPLTPQEGADALDAKRLEFLNTQTGRSWEMLRSIEYSTLDGYRSWLDKGIRDAAIG